VARPETTSILTSIYHMLKDGTQNIDTDHEVTASQPARKAWLRCQGHALHSSRLRSTPMWQ